jgi:hypothetical protein
MEVKGYARPFFAAACQKLTEGTTHCGDNVTPISRVLSAITVAKPWRVKLAKSNPAGNKRFHCPSGFKV